MAIGGSIRKLSLKGRVFSVTADADASRSIGGDSNEVQANGDGTARIIKTMQPWSVEGLQIAIEENRNDQQFLQNLANENGYWDVTLTFSGGATYGGKGQLTGDPPQYSSQSASAAIALMGEGVLTKQ